MAEPQESQLLSSFTAEGMTGLRGATDPESLSVITKEFLVRAQQYQTLRARLNDTDVQQKIGESLVKNDPAKLRDLLLDIFTEAGASERPEVPAGETFESGAVPVSALPTQERVARIAETETASQAVIDERKSAKRHEFAQKLAENFVHQTRREITEDQRRAEIEMETHRIEQGLAAPDWYNNKEQIAATVGQSFFGGPTEENAVKRATITALAGAERVARDEEAFETKMAPVASSVAMDGVVVGKPDVFFKIAADQVEQSDAPVARIIGRAAALENATAGFTGGGPELPQNLSFLAHSPFQTLVAKAVDALPEDARAAVINVMVGGALDRTINRLGRGVTGQQWFRDAIANGNRGLPDRKGALRSVSGGLVKALAETANLVYRGPMDDAALAYFIAVQQKITVSTFVVPQQFVTAAVCGQTPGLLSSGSNWALRYGAKRATQALIKKGVEKAAVSGAVKLGAEALTGAATGGWGLVAAAALSALNWLKNKGVALLKSLLFMGNSKNPEDNLLLVVGAGVVLVFFLPILPLLNLPAFNQSMIDTSLATGAGSETVGAVGPIGPVTLSCAKTADIYIYQGWSDWARYTCFDARPNELACKAPNTACTIGHSGCGSASTAMIINAFGGNTDVKTVWNRQHSPDVNGYHYDYEESVPDCASWDTGPLQILKEATLSTSPLGVDGWDKAEKVLSGCGLVLALGHAHIKDPATGAVVITGHFIVITGIHREGGVVTSVDTLDPAQPNLKEQRIVGPDATFVVDQYMWGVVK